MHLGQVVLLVYALFILLGGFKGYKAGSRASLTAAGVSAALLIVALVVSFLALGPGLWGGAVVSLALCVVFLLRFVKTRKLMPSGLLLGTSVVALVALVASALGAG